MAGLDPANDPSGSQSITSNQTSVHPSIGHISPPWEADANFDFSTWCSSTFNGWPRIGPSYPSIMRRRSGEMLRSTLILHEQVKGSLSFIIPDSIARAKTGSASTTTRVSQFPKCIGKKAWDLPQLQSLEERNDKLMKRAQLDMELAEFVDSHVIQQRLRIPTRKMKLYSSIIETIQYRVESVAGLSVLPFGSFTTLTCTTASPLYCSTLFAGNFEKTWVARVLQALSMPAHRLDGKNAVVGQTNSQQQLVFENIRIVTLENGVKLVAAKVAGIPVEIHANQSRGIALQGLIEEIDLLVGQNHLFKRSLVLFYGWMKPINPQNVDTAPVCTEAMMTTVMIFVFNSRYGEISNPLHALVLALDVFASVDWKDQALGIYGVVDRYQQIGAPYFRQACSSIWHFPLKPLVGDALLEKYSVRQVKQGGNASRVEAQDEDPEWFKFSGMSLIDPVDSTNNLGSHIQLRQAKELLDYVDSSIARVAKSLRSRIEGTQSLGQLVLQLMFGHVLQDLVDSAIAERVTRWSQDWSEFHRHLDHASKFAMPNYSEAELVDIMVHILQQENGAVTVGKIGSLMHNITKNHSLPAMIKRKYGGLKKLLKRHQSTFDIGVDHPHNPHVCLKSKQPTLKKKNIPIPSGQFKDKEPTLASLHDALHDLDTGSQPVPLFVTNEAAVESPLIPASRNVDQTADSRPSSRGFRVDLKIDSASLISLHSTSLFRSPPSQVIGYCSDSPASARFKSSSSSSDMLHHVKRWLASRVSKNIDIAQTIKSFDHQAEASPMHMDTPKEYEYE